MKEYYEKYWTGDGDVFDYEVTTPESKRRLLQTLYNDSKSGKSKK